MGGRESNRGDRGKGEEEEEGEDDGRCYKRSGRRRGQVNEEGVGKRWERLLRGNGEVLKKGLVKGKRWEKGKVKGSRCDNEWCYREEC